MQARPGQNATVVLTATAVKDALILPVTAVAGRLASGQVSRRDGDSFATVNVKLGASDGTSIIILVGTLGRDYLEAVNARLGDKLPTYSAIVDVPSSANIQVVRALQEHLAHFRPGIASAQSPQRPRHMGVVR